MRTMQELRAKRAEAVKAARDLVEANPGDKWNASCEEQYDKMLATVDQIDGEIARNQRVLDLAASEATGVSRRADQLGAGENAVRDLLQVEKDVMLAFLRGGRDNISDALQSELAAVRAAAGIQNTMSTTTPAEGGYTVPREFGDRLLEELKLVGGARNAAQVITTDSGAPIDWPTVDETSQVGELIGENASVADQDVAFGTRSLATYKFSSKGVAVPFELLQDTKIDLEGYIFRALAERIGRVTNTYYTTGTGTGQPEGVVTNATSGKVGTTGQTLSVIYDDLVDLIHSVDPSYRVLPSCGFMFNDSTLKVLRKLKDTQGRPLWQGGLTEKQPDSILSYPYTINQNMANMAANAKSILFGDFNKFIIRDVTDVMLFRFTDSAYSRKGQVGFLAMMRSGSACIHATYNAIKYYQNSAT